jgi:hypothetical protein
MGPRGALPRLRGRLVGDHWWGEAPERPNDLNEAHVRRVYLVCLYLDACRAAGLWRVLTSAGATS